MYKYIPGMYKYIPGMYKYIPGNIHGHQHLTDFVEVHTKYILIHTRYIIVCAQDEKCYSMRMLVSAVFEYKRVHTTGHYPEELAF